MYQGSSFIYYQWLVFCYWIIFC